MAKNLYNLTAVTTVNDSDLLHVNQGSVSSDKKVTKQNLLKEVNSSISSINNSLANKMSMLPWDITSEANLTTHLPEGTFPWRCVTNFTLGNITVPAYTRGIILNYAGSYDASLVAVSPTSLIYGFRNNGTWHCKMLSIS